MRRFLCVSRRSTSSVVYGAKFSPINLTLNDVLVSAAEQEPDKACAHFDMFNKSFTFAEMNAEAERIGAALLSLGLKSGDAVAIWGPNQPEWLVTKWAAAKVNMPLVNINPLYTARELEYALNKVKVKALLCPKSIGPVLNYHNVLSELIADFPQQDRFDLNIKHIPTLKNIVYYSVPDTEPTEGFIRWSELEEMAESKDYAQLATIKCSPGDIGNIQFTSGTTGMPKAASLTHYNIVNNAKSLTEHINLFQNLYNSSTITANVLPLYHIFGFVAGSLTGALNRQTNVYPAPGFSAEHSIKSIEKRSCTMLIGTPTMFTDILHHPSRVDHDMSSLNLALVGGAPATPAMVMTAKAEFNCRVGVGYGMTENSCATFITPPGLPDDLVTSTVGLPIPGVDAKVIDPETEETLPEGEIGELCTRGFVIFKGYVGDEAKTRESFTNDGEWFKTGDLAIIKDGITKITGRSKDMIIRGGENIQPTEIENEICRFGPVQDCYVIGVPSKRLGEEVAAYIKLNEGVTCSIDEIIEHASQGLARFKVPKYIKLTENFPQTVTGKIKKFELRQQALEDFPELRNELE